MSETENKHGCDNARRKAQGDREDYIVLGQIWDKLKVGYQPL
jgi:hypothetical protein